MTWRVFSLGDITESVEYGFTASATFEPRGPKLLRITDIQNGTVDWSNVPYSSETPENAGRRLRPGDIVFARTGATTGKSYLIRECPADAIFASYLIRVRVSATIDPTFLAHFFQSKGYWDQITLSANGLAQPGVNSTVLKRLRVPVPTLDEQRRIAAILERADDLRRKRRIALENLDKCPQAIFHEMFGDPADVNFSSQPLSSVCKRITDGTHQSPRWSEAGIPFIFVSNVRHSVISLDTNSYISEAVYRELTRGCPIEVGDVLYTAVGSYGNAAAVREPTPFAFQRHIAHIKPDRSRIDSTFLEAMLQTAPLRRQADRVARGVAQKTVTLADLKSFSIICPPMAMQRHFAHKVAQINTVRDSYKVQQSGLDALFASLQDHAFAGTLTSSTVEAALASV